MELSQERTGCQENKCEFFNETKNYITMGKDLRGKKVDLMFYKRDLKGQGNFRFSIFWTINYLSDFFRKSHAYLLMKVKQESEKAGLKHNLQKTEIMASSSITSWQIDGKKMETMTDIIFLGSKITADTDCSHELKDACSLEEKLWQTWTTYWIAETSSANDGP